MALVKPAYSFDDGGVVFVLLGQAIVEEPIVEDRGTAITRFGGTGKKQTNFRYDEEIYRLVHQFESPVIKEEMRTMMRFVRKGNIFKFYEDQSDLLTFVELEALDDSFSFERMFKKNDLWAFTVSARLKI